MDHKSWTMKTELPVDFAIYLVDNLFEENKNILVSNGKSDKKIRRLIFIDEKVYSLHGEKIEQYFLKKDIHYEIVSIISTEKTKDINNLLIILNAMENFRVLRQSEPVIAIGGGVLLDLVGFAASIYRRGIPYIKIPTTLIALIDASIGVKTAINHFGNRNRLGTYYPPLAVYLDKSFLSTLERREFSNGLGEILKMALIKDSRLFEILEKYGKEIINTKFQIDVSSEIIDRSIRTMLEELEPNLWEKILQRSVDFGHSFSPLIEMRAMPQLYHGEAVTIDMLLSCIISNNRGFLSEEELKRIFNTTKSLELPLYHPLFGDSKVLKESLEEIMIHRDGKQNLPIIPSIGKFIFLNDVTDQELEKAAIKLREMNENGKR